MFKTIVPKATVKELEKIDYINQQLIFIKIKDLEAGIFIFTSLFCYKNC